MAGCPGLAGERGKRYVHLMFNLIFKLVLFQSDSSGDEGMVCVSDFLDRKHGLDRWGGPGEVKALLDDGVPPGPGDEEEEVLGMGRPVGRLGQIIYLLLSTS